MPDTKDLRLVLKRKQDVDAFNTAKQLAERELGITLRDNEFARRLVVQAVKRSTVEVPDGWKLVPEFSHSDMDVAAHDTGIIDRFQAETIWEVMVKAAPAPPEQESK